MPILIHIVNFNVLRFGAHAVRLGESLAKLVLGYDENTFAVLDKVPADFDLYWVIYHTLASLNVWLAGLFVIVTASLPFIVVSALTNPGLQDVVDAVRGKRVYRVTDWNTTGRRNFNAHTNQAFQSDC